MLSSVSFSACTPIGLDYTHGNAVELNQNLYAFADGFNMYVSPLLENVRDTTMNNGEVILLTDKLKLEDCLRIRGKNNEPVSVATSIEMYGYGFWCSDDNTNITLVPDKTNINTMFILVFDNTNSTVRVKSNDKYLTYNDINRTFNLQDDYIVGFSGTSPQIFKYILDDKKLMLFTSFSFLSAQYAISYNLSVGVLSAVAGISNNGVAPDNSIFTISEYPTADVVNYKSGQSNWVQYNSTDYDLSVKSAISSVAQNILLTSPFKSVSGDKFNININGLKNILTPDGEQNINTDNSVNQRDYYSVFTGVNQEGGHNNIFLSYEGNTQGIDFKKGKYTWFHYPNSAPTISVNDTTLAVNGSIAGDVPFRSDKIFKKRAGYKSSSNWGESLPITQQDGMWVCTWLSGSDDGMVLPVWIDRYINPTITGNLSSVNDVTNLLLSNNTGSVISTNLGECIAVNGSSIITKTFKSTQQAYIDVESTLTFDPGVLYIYHHIGESDNLSIVSSISGDTKSYYISDGKILSDVVVGTDQLLYVNNWSNQQSADISPYRNNINIVNTSYISRDSKLLHNTMSTEGSAYGISQLPITLSQYEGFTLSVNVYAEDWSNLYGDQIVGNYFDGGMGLFVNNPILTPYFTLYEKTSGRVIELNSGLNTIQDNKLSNIAATSAVQYLLRKDHEDSYFVIDSGNNLLRYDSASILLSSIDLSSYVSGNILDVQMDGIGNIHLLSNQGAYKIDYNSGAVDYNFTANGSSKIAVDLNNNISVLPSGIIDYCVDSNNNIFTIKPTKIYKNGTEVFTSTNLKRICCDMNDNIWVLHGNKISKLTDLPVLVCTTTLSSSSPSNDINMVLCRNLPGGGVVDEYIVILDNTARRILKVDMDGNIILSRGSLNTVIPKGDPSGYDYQRKFGRIQQRNMKGIHAKVYTTHNVTSKSKVFTVYADTSKLIAGWHNVSMVFSVQKGTLSILIDGKLISSTSSDINANQYTYRPNNYRNETRLMLGVSSAKNGTLREKIQQPKSYIFNGKFNDLRLYGTPITNQLIKYVSRNGYADIYSDMTWNMPVGNNQYIEEIERFFQHRLPGNKSQLFNLKIRGYKPINDQVKGLFENNIRQVITKIVPAYTQLKDIIWVQ